MTDPVSRHRQTAHLVWGMNTITVLSTVTVQASPAHAGVWPVLVGTAVVLAAILQGLRRLRPGGRAGFQLLAGFLVLATSCFFVVFPVLMPAREQLDAIAQQGDAEILTFIASTATVGVAAGLLLAAQFLRVLAVAIARGVTRGRQLAAGQQVVGTLPAAVTRAVEPRQP